MSGQKTIEWFKEYMCNFYSKLGCSLLQRIQMLDLVEKGIFADVIEDLKMRSCWIRVDSKSNNKGP